MTQTLRRPPAVNPHVRRRGFVYAYDTLKVDRTTGAILDGSTEVGYVGKTVQKLTTRDDQHRGLIAGPDGESPECQPFSDLIVGSIRIVEQGEWTEQELDDRETFWIAQLAPAYNHQKQPRGNASRVMMSDARRHRDARDVAKNLQPRDWPAFRNGWKPGTVAADAVAPKASRLPEWARKRLQKAGRRLAVAGAWLGGLLAAAGVLWLALALFAAPRTREPWQTWPVLSLALVTWAVALWLVIPRVRGRGKKRWQNRAWAAVGVTLGVAMAASALLEWWTGSK